MGSKPGIDLKAPEIFKFGVIGIMQFERTCAFELLVTARVADTSGAAVAYGGEVIGWKSNKQRWEVAKGLLHIRGIGRATRCIALSIPFCRLILNDVGMGIHIGRDIRSTRQVGHCAQGEGMIDGNGYRRGLSACG